jgi:hypothetical protein
MNMFSSVRNAKSFARSCSSAELGEGVLFAVRNLSGQEEQRRILPMTASEYLRERIASLEANAESQRQKHPNIPTAGMELESAAAILKIVAQALEQEKR